MYFRLFVVIDNQLQNHFIDRNWTNCLVWFIWFFFLWFSIFVCCVTCLYRLNWAIMQFFIHSKWKCLFSYETTLFVAFNKQSNSTHARKRTKKKEHEKKCVESFPHGAPHKYKMICLKIDRVHIGIIDFPQKMHLI